MGQLLAVGVDGARGGWLAALGHGDPTDVTHVELQLVETFEEIAALRGQGADGVPVTVDIPMGLLNVVEPRPCDKEARKLLGVRASAVFAPPSRSLAGAATYQDARKVVAAAKLKDPAVKGLSAQSFGIAPKVSEADKYLQADSRAQSWLWECHPELSFKVLADGEILRGKKSVSGQAKRLQLLCDRFPGLLDKLVAFGPDGRSVETGDALDALAALNTALRVRRGAHEELGGETDDTGLIMRMVM
ncbi:MAG: DUF429 domain-containing protein [Solirubrobacteraceae bacterium MAG38_C4-C5]|nr:DUF429 domain-containing protein [Candidatus Siliceabacter maunaloa]